MVILSLLFTFMVLLFAKQSNSKNLPTSYEYYTHDGIRTGLNADQRQLLLNGKNITVFSGAIHYFRIHKTSWRDRLRKMRAAGLNTIDVYVPWNLHEHQSGKFDFGNGGSDFQDFLNITEFLTMVKEEDLFVFLRAGPYICGEWEFGGFPSFLLREKNMKLRTNDQIYLKYVKRYFSQLLPILAKQQFTSGGPIIGFQIENEYGNTQNNDKPYLQALVDIYKNNGINEILYTSDPLTAGTLGALPGELLMMANFNSNPEENLNNLDFMQPNRPSMVMEFYPGWFDHYGETHHTVEVEGFRQNYEIILSHPASVSIYMFTGSTSFGFLSGANLKVKGQGMDNSGLQPDTTSYDYDSPISENGDLTEKWHVIKNLIEKYNPVKTALPTVKNSSERVALASIKIQEQILLTEIIDNFTIRERSKFIKPMELLEINNGSGQSFGYVVYRKTNLTIHLNSTLKIQGYVRDTVLVLLNGKLLTPVLSSQDDLNKFGYWRLLNSTISLGEVDVHNATLDLVVENHSRNNYGTLDMFQQFKGLSEDVLINERVVTDWEIIPIEFKKDWNKKLSQLNWHRLGSKDATPALYRTVFNVSKIADTYLDVQEWRKGIAIINGFVLGRIFAIGPQQTLYIPAGLLRKGQNELIIFEHFSAPDHVKFSKNPIFGIGKYIQ